MPSGGRLRRATWVALLAAVWPACRTHTPQAAQAVTVSVPYELDTLDPHARDLVGQAAISQNLYEGLVAKDGQLAVHPALAERWISPDPLTWVFSLRRGVRFHDGRALTSADVVWSFERLKAHPELQVGVYAQDVESVKATGELSVEIRTQSPAAVLLNRISTVMIVPASSSAAALASQPLGTGPYRFVSWTPGQSIELQRNEDYWGRRPALASVTYLLDRSDEEALEDVATQRSQIAQLSSRQAERAAAADTGLRLLRQPGIFLKYLGYDLSREVTPQVSLRGNPFRDLRVRQAIHLAIDRRRLVERLPVFAVPAGQLVPPVIFGFDPGLPEAAPDPPRARELLAAAGYPQGFGVTLQARQLTGQAAEHVREMLGEVGIRVTVEQVSERDFFRVASGGPTFFLTRYGCDNGDASDVLNAGIHSVDPLRHFGSANYGHYSSPALDAAIEKSAQPNDHKERRRQLQAIVRQAMQELVWIPLYFDEDVYLVRRPYVLTPRADSYLRAVDVALAPGR